MLWNIFTYEIRYWFKQPIAYIFASIFFVFGFSAMAISGDILGETTVVEGSRAFANSSFSIISYFYDLNLFILFVVPVFIGGSIYRDYSSNSFMVLYSYPIRKFDYFTGKFLSGILITSFVLFLMGAGLFFGSLLPGLNPLLIGTNLILNYFQPYFLVVLPNLLFMSMIVFSVVLLSRNSYAGFTTILLLYVLRRILLFVLGGPDNEYLITLLDPFGQAAVFKSVQNWSVLEANSFTVPVSKVLILNRAIWIGISSLCFILAYQRFSLSQNIEAFQFLKRATKKTIQNEKKAKIKRNLVSSITPDYSFKAQLLSTWKISNYEFKSIVLSKAFLALLTGSFLFMFLILGQVNPQYTTRIQPLTQVMLLVPALFYSFLVMIITFLYAGILIHRDRRSRIDQLVDVCAIPNWSLLGAKFLTLLKLQTILLSVIMITGIAIQIWKGYFHFEIPLYLFNIYGILFITLVIWAMMALFVQTIVPNQYIGFFLLIMLAVGLSGLDSIGIKLPIFNFNAAPLTEYSDLSGFGNTLPSYFVHKLYWALFGSLLLILSYLFWLRGVSKSLKERLSTAIERYTQKLVLASFLILFGFLGTGFMIYTNVYPSKPVLSISKLDAYKVDAEQRFSKYKNIPQPRLSKVKMSMNLFPKKRSYTSHGTLFFVNKSTFPIDTLLVSYSGGAKTSYSFNRGTEIVNKDSVLSFDIFALTKSLLPLDTLQLTFEKYSTPSTLFRTNSQVRSNGTFLLADAPVLGYPEFELSNEAKRNTYGLPPQKNTQIHPSDSLARENSYVGKNIDLFDFEATVSTSEDQIAFAPGTLIKKWKKEHRAYFHYKTKAKIRNGIVFNSGKFDVFKDSLNGISLEIYHHKTHDFNLNRMMRAMKATLTYSTKNFGEYPFEQLRIIEFPKQYGRFAQSFANTIPFSELAGFISKEDESENRFDDVFRLTSHEMAHQWWGHQVVPAEALGSRMISEGLAEYTALKVLEQEYGVEKKQLYLSLIRKSYLEQRRRVQTESPLSVTEPNESYVHYAKGLVIFNSMNTYLGDETFNLIMNRFFDEFKSTEAPYPTSFDLVERFEMNVPDSLQYLIRDLFRTVTLYDNSITNSELHDLENEVFEIELEFNTSKFRNPDSDTKIFIENGMTLKYEAENGEIIQSLPLNDYIEIGVFGEKDELIHLKKYKVSEINNSVQITTKQKPTKVVLDPLNLLIEENNENNKIEF